MPSHDPGLRIVKYTAQAHDQQTKGVEAESGGFVGGLHGKEGLGMGSQPPDSEQAAILQMNG